VTYPGKNPNPAGTNGTEEPGNAYGAIKRATEQVRSAPLAGSAGPSTRRGGHSGQHRGPQPHRRPPPPHPVDSQPMAYQPQLAQVWAELAAVPGASPLVQQMAEQAAQGGV
jgi:hypothetical protein